MKLNRIEKIYIYIFLLIFCLLCGILRQIVYIKLNVYSLEEDSAFFFKWIEFGLGVSYLLIMISIYFYILKLAIEIFDNKIIDGLLEHIIIGFTPYIIFVVLNIYYLEQSSYSYLMTINKTGIGEIIPNISLNLSKYISSILSMVPLLMVFFIVKGDNKISKSFKIISFPLFLLLIFNLIKMYISKNISI